MTDEHSRRWSIATEVERLLADLEWLREPDEWIDFDHDEWLTSLPYDLYVELRQEQERSG